MKKKIVEFNYRQQQKIGAVLASIQHAHNDNAQIAYINWRKCTVTRAWKDFHDDVVPFKLLSDYRVKFLGRIVSYSASTHTIRLTKSDARFIRTVLAGWFHNETQHRDLSEKEVQSVERIRKKLVKIISAK